jgi:mRNA interferase MazF
MKRGDVFFADLFPRSGSEQSGRRPVVIVSHDSFNAAPNWHSIIVVPLSTSVNQARRHGTVVPLFAGEGGLPVDSVAICHQITTIDKSKLHNRLGSLTSEQMDEIEFGLKSAMQMP